MNVSVATLGRNRWRWHFPLLAPGSTAALLTLGDDREVANVLGELTPKVIGIMEATGARNRDCERLSSEVQPAMDRFRDIAANHLGIGSAA